MVNYIQATTCLVPMIIKQHEIWLDSDQGCFVLLVLFFPDLNFPCRVLQLYVICIHLMHQSMEAPSPLDPGIAWA